METATDRGQRRRYHNETFPSPIFVSGKGGGCTGASAHRKGREIYPTRPVPIVVGFGAGGSADILMRLISQWVSERRGQPFVIENRPGAGGNLATEAVVRTPPDGHTLLAVGVVNAWNATLYDHLRVDFVRDIAPVASLNRG
jgi:tripartite-type tricarboxylate transporter receptor subunit TctC